MLSSLGSAPTRASGFIRVFTRTWPLAWLIWGATQLFAAETSPAAGSALEEITVTAQRRSENLQTVPIAITAVNAAEMERNGIHDLGSLAGQVPGLAFSSFAPGQNIVSLRGVSSNDDGAGTDNSVAAFVDDVYLGRVSNINPEMYDVDRVEVLRGPQGTLYGKNTIGGAINIISSRPNTSALDIKSTADFGNYDRHNFSGLITGPIGGDWAGKLVVSTRNSDGWVNNVVLHTKEKNDDGQAVRGQLLRVGESSELLLSADYQQLNDEDMARTPLTHMTNNLPFSALGAYQALCGESNPSCATNPSNGFARQFAYGVSAKFTDHVSPSSDLISISAYRRSYNRWSMDSLGAVLPLANDVTDETNQYSEELRWVSSPTDQVKYVGGLWFLREDTNRLRLFLLPSIDPNPDDADRYRGINRTTSEAAFGQIDWQFAHLWTLTIGGRYSHDFKHIDNDAVHGISGILHIIPNTFANEREAGWGKFTPKMSLRYEPTSALNLYATVSEGFKSGGFAASPTSLAETNPLRPEQATNIELGAKAELSQRLQLNLALFDTRYKDLQIQAFGPPGGCVPTPSVPCFGQFETFNAGTSEAKGAELEFRWLPVDKLTVSATYGYLDSKFKNVYLPNASVYTLLNGQTVDLRNQSGQDTFRAPRNKGSLEILHQLPLGSLGELETSAGYSYTSNQRGALEPYANQPGYGLIDGSLTWVSPGLKYEISLWGKNLANRVWVSHVYTTANEVFGVYGDPRMYGARLTWHFAP
jgi:iron complex outermembrane recepter protein